MAGKKQSLDKNVDTLPAGGLMSTGGFFAVRQGKADSWIHHRGFMTKT